LVEAYCVRNGLTCLLELFGQDRLPSDTYVGDGTPIPPETVRHLIDTYRASKLRFDDEADDLLVIDNMLTAHGRERYQGERRIGVAMAGLPTAEDTRCPAHDNSP
jgi:hypothetical protein